MNSTHRRQMRAARERDYIAWAPDDPEPWAMPAPDLSLQTEQQQRGTQSDKENFREVRDDRG